MFDFMTIASVLSQTAARVKQNPGSIDTILAMVNAVHEDFSAMIARCEQNLSSQETKRLVALVMKCKDARIDASLRVSVGLEPPPPEPAGGRTHRSSYTGDPPPSSARAGERHCPPARTVQARAPARRPHRPGPGSDIVSSRPDGASRR